jgi:hypothetical protein
METDPERMTRFENELAGLAATMRDLVLALGRRDESPTPLERPDVGPSVSNPVSEGSHAPREFIDATSGRNPNFERHSDTRHLKPATPNDFGGDRTKGRAFLNSCELYQALVPSQFADDHAKIMWAFSFMKSDRAARFVDRQMRGYLAVGSLTYASWGDFVAEFILEFCPKNEVQVARTNLETHKYFQGSKTVDEFREMIDRARYFEGSHIVLKFRQGLNHRIQDHVACMTTGRPSDKIPRQWYNAAILCNENHITNEAFTASSRISNRPDMSLSGSGIVHRPLSRPSIITHTPSHHSPSMPTTSHPP